MSSLVGNLKRNSLVVLLAGCAFVAQGCAVALVAGGVAAGAGGVAYVRGDLEAITDQTVKHVHEASVKTMRDMGMLITTKRVDLTSSEVVGYTADDKKVKIKATFEQADQTKVSIRVGVFGDKARSQYIYDRLRENLIEQATAADSDES